MAEEGSAQAESWAALRAVLLVAGLLLITWIVVPLFVFDSPPKYRLETLRTMKGLEFAIKSYQTEYNRYPMASAATKNTVTASEGRLLKVLMAQDPELNPRKIRFYDPPTARGGMGGYLVDSAGVPRMVDFYGQPYRICIDYDGDGEIIDPHSKNKEQPDTLSSGLIIWSGGEDGDPTTWKDNLTTWQ